MHLTDAKLWINKTLGYIIEYGIYLLAVFLFTDKGESFRSIGIYMPPLALIIRTYIMRREPFTWENPLFVLTIALFVSSILSSLAAQDLLGSISWFKRNYLKLFLIFVVIYSTFDKTELIFKLSLLFAMLAVFFTIMLFYDYATKAIMPDGIVNAGTTIRKYVPPLDIFIPFIPFALALSNKKTVKTFWYLALFAGIVAMVMTGARGGWISLGISLTIWALFYYRLNKIGLKTIAFFVLAIITGIAIILSIIPSSHIFQKIKQGFDSSYRLEIQWKSSVENYIKFPPVHKILGKGLSEKTMNEDFEEWYKIKTGHYPESSWPKNPHNFYIFILYKQGLLGLSIYLLLIFIFVKKLVSKITKETVFERKALGIAILASFIGSYLTHGLFEDLKFMPLGFLLGIAGAYLNIHEGEK